MFKEYFDRLNNLEEEIINEMAYDRNTAVNRCADLGKPFIEHFKKVVDEGKNSKDYIHHCLEMQAWFNDARNIVLKPKSKHITNNQLIDWFFTRGSDVETLLGDNYEDIYNIFMIKLLNIGTVKDCFDNILDS